MGVFEKLLENGNDGKIIYFTDEQFQKAKKMTFSSSNVNGMNLYPFNQCELKKHILSTFNFGT